MINFETFDMKFFNSFLLTALLSFIAGIYISYWWFFAVIAFLVAIMIHQKGFKAFFAGFLALFILWFVLAFWMDLVNEGVLSVKIATLLPLGGSKWLLMIITASMGGLVAGFAALSGSYLRSTSQKKYF